MTPFCGRRLRAAFTLIELLVSLTVVLFVMVILAQMVNAVSKGWASGEKRVETFQSGRAVLDLISRELAPAAIASPIYPSPSPGAPLYQLIQNPFPSAPYPAPVPAFTPATAGNCDSLFWQAHVHSSTSSDLCEIGYYLADPNRTGTGPYQLKRLFVPPSSNKFLIHTKSSTDYRPSATAAPWLILGFSSQSDFDTVTSVVADGILGMWIRCLDTNGDPIPWFKSNSPDSVSGMNVKYNSAARFQTAVAPVSSPTPTPTPLPWPYTSNASPVTAQANRLPSAIEIYLITVDSATIRRNPTFPTTPSITSPDQVSTVVSTFVNTTLPANGIDSARLFTSRVRITSGSQ